MTHRLNHSKQCIDLDKAEYEIVRNSILKNLFAYGTMTSDELSSLVQDHLNSKSDNALWRYYSLVMHQLETRGEIRYVPNTHPPQIEIAT